MTGSSAPVRRDLEAAHDTEPGRASRQGIVGFGRIGQALAHRARGFSMRVLYYDIDRRPAEVEQELGAECRDLEICFASPDSSAACKPHPADPPSDQRPAPGP